MRKLFLTFGLIAMSGAAFAQGYVNFNPTTTMIVETNNAFCPLFGGSGVGGGSGSTMAVANQYYYALLISPWTGSVSTDQNVWDGSWSYGGITATNSSVLAGRVQTEGNSINVESLVGWNAGTTNNIVLVGWSADWGSSWSAVSAELAAYAAGYIPLGSYFGESTIGYLVPNAASPGAALFASGPTANGLPIYNPATNPMVLYTAPLGYSPPSTPEPSTLALAGLGGLSLLLFRRRNVRNQIPAAGRRCRSAQTSSAEQTTNTPGHMKKLFLTLGLTTLSGAAFTQGYLNFNAGIIPIFATNSAVSTLLGGSGSGGVSDLTFAGTGANVSAYLFALLISPYTGTVSSDTAVWDGSWSLALATVGANTALPMITSNSVVAGRVAANMPGGTSSIQMTGWANGTYNNIVLVGWSANLGSTWSAVSSLMAAIAANPSLNTIGGFFGETGIGYYTPNLGTPGGAIFNSVPTANGTPIDNSSANPAMLYGLPIPEPSTLALAGLGGLSLLLLRRRK